MEHLELYRDYGNYIIFLCFELELGNAIGKHGVQAQGLGFMVPPPPAHTTPLSSPLIRFPLNKPE